MVTRRDFLTTGAAGAVAADAVVTMCGEGQAAPPAKPTVISTWQHGMAANAAAWTVLSKGGRALDAVETGVRVSESDPKVSSVGYGGLPDRDGQVTLDACIMDERGECGSVAFLQHIKNPISVARRVMEKTPHVMLVGDGALKFALREGFERQELLTDQARQAWKDWKAKNAPAECGPDNHDTIGMVALDSRGNLSGACTTSGLAWKLHGRVGDSPIIGAGLYVDNEVGAATATGVGEAVIRAVGSFLVVELMRAGNTPADACRLAVERVARKTRNWRDIQVGFVALDKQGLTGGYAIQQGFEYALRDSSGARMITPKSRL